MPESNWVSLAARLLFALAAGGAIGWNRQTHGKPAGFRTHMLVGLGSALFVIVPVETGTPNSDAVSRAIQGIATGVGFIGAGEIVHYAATNKTNPLIKGLTSAAALWVTAALGIAAACGLWQVCLIGTLLTLLVLIGAKWVEQWIPLGRHEE